jgi:hypothetical protein
MTGTGIETQAEGVAVKPTGVNAFELIPVAAKFQLSMKGFDPRRDLIVRLVEARERDDFPEAG